MMLHEKIQGPPFLKGTGRSRVGLADPDVIEAGSRMSGTHCRRSHTRGNTVRESNDQLHEAI